VRRRRGGHPALSVPGPAPRRVNPSVRRHALVARTAHSRWATPAPPAHRAAITHARRSRAGRVSLALRASLVGGVGLARTAATHVRRGGDTRVTCGGTDATSGCCARAKRERCIDRRGYGGASGAAVWRVAEREWAVRASSTCRRTDGSTRCRAAPGTLSAQRPSTPPPPCNGVAVRSATAHDAAMQSA